MKYLFIRLQSGMSHGLLGYYYIVRDAEKLTCDESPNMVRVDPYINFVWFEPPIKGSECMDFIVEWHGYLSIINDGYYILFMECDDGCMLWLNNELVINGWREQPPTIYQTNSMFLSRGSYEIRVKYFNVGPFGLVKLGWVTPNGVVDVIPRDNLYTRRGNSVIIKGLSAGTTVELWSSRMLAKAVVDDSGLAFIRLNTRHPIDGYFRVYGNGGEELQSPVIRDIWDGDVFEVKEIP